MTALLHKLTSMLKSLWRLPRIKDRNARELERLRTELNKVRDTQDRLMILSAQILDHFRGNGVKSLQDAEYRVYSQWGEDGIIDFLTKNVPIENKTFIEFGVESFTEANCRLLLEKRGWSGFVLDGDMYNVRAIRAHPNYWRTDLRAECAFVDRENINDLLRMSGFGPDLGLLAIDIDGNDYHVWEALSVFDPRIVVCEYNAVFGPDREIVVPYDAAFSRSLAHYSCLYFGASLGALIHLGKKKGYALVGTCSAGVNAFFVKKEFFPDSLTDLRESRAFNDSVFRDSRDLSGNLAFVRGKARLDCIRGLPVLNVRTGVMETL